MSQDDRKFLEQVAAWNKEHGKPPPKDLVEVPDVLDAYADLWECFLETGGARQVGMEASPILCSEVEAWCRVYGVAKRRRRLFWRVVRRLDALWRELSREQEKVGKP